ncbi:MAG TPA: Plug domain-containing protein, partial [Bryobacteraceae bacterium]
SETRNLGKLVLEVGGSTEQVTVTASTTPVQTASSERSASVLAQQLKDFSLKGRDPFGMVQLIPGVVDSNVGNRDLESAYSMGGLSINGMSPQAVNVAVDGVTEMDEGGNYTAFVTPNMESVVEMRVLTNGYQAEYGRQSGGTINLITKGGGKDFHGSGHFDHRHEDLNANNFFNNRQGIARPLYRYMIAGYSIGGPAYIPRKWNADRHRLFFFVSQEFTQIAQPTNTVSTNEPTAAERLGDFSNTRNAAGAIIPIINPQTGTPFPGNKVPNNMFDPTGSAILNLLPLPNGYTNPAPGQQYTANFLASQTPPYNRRNTMLRFDGNITSKLSMYYRYGQDVDNQTYPFVVAPGVGTNVRFLPGYIHGVHLTYTATPTMVNEFLFGNGHDNYGFYHTTPDSEWFRTSSLNPPTLRPFPTGPQYENYLPCATFAGGAASNPGYWTPGGQQSPGPGCSLTPYKNFNDNYVFQDDLTKIVGSHSIKAGAMWEWNSKVEPSAGAQYYGNFNFGSSTNNPLDTGYGYANALLGVYQTYTEASNRAVPNAHWSELDWYVQDNWRISKKLTIDYGMRFLHASAVSDDSKTYSDFYQQLWDPKQAPVLYQQGSAGGKSAALNPLTGQTTFASLIGTIIPGHGNPVDGTNIDGLTGKGDFYFFPRVVAAPRLGFAWDPKGDGKMVIRASAGLFYNRTTTSVPGSGAAPVVYTPVLYYSTIAGIPQAASNAVISAQSASAIYGHQPIERTHAFNLTIQRDIGFNTVVDVGYVGNFDRHALGAPVSGSNSSYTLQLNPVPYQAYANPANLFNNTEINSNLLRQAYPGMGAISYTTYAYSAVNYNALQASAQHRLTNGLAFGAAYTFSKALGVQGSDPYTKAREWYYGPVQTDRTQLMTWNFAYSIPTFNAHSKVVKAVFGSWTLTGIGIITTGAPTTPTCSSTAAFPYSDPSLTGIGTNSISGVRCYEVADPKNFSQNFNNNFNTSAFALAPIGTFGNVGVGILRQPTWWNFDSALDKKISIKERLAIRLRFQAFNIFNHTEFNRIGTTFQWNAANVNLNTTSGQFTNTQAPRQMALSARIEF